jgi:hypothetical protein
MTGAAVRSAPRKRADLARGLRSISASDGRIAFRVSSRNVGCGGSASNGSRRDLRSEAEDRDLRKVLTRRSSRE